MSGKEVRSMAYVQVPKDLTKVKTKVMLNLTKRQLICFSLAGAVGVPFYLLTRHVLGQTMAASLMIILVMPFFFFAMYEKDGRPLEKILLNIYRQKIKRPGIRPYRTDNFYRRIQDEIYEKEVRGIGRKENGKARAAQAAGHGGPKNKRKK